MKQIDYTKPVMTRDGRKVQVIADRMNHPQYPVAAIVTDVDGTQSCHTFTPEGHFRHGYPGEPIDLVQVPQTISRTYWVNVYKDMPPTYYITREQADAAAMRTRVACFQWTFTVTEGEGL